ncbi:hypothetical protein M758_UG009000 [Ceratodon purpureus]|nr:hypothetical protein M758_UG009000 [Ceratodon purpureus]
MVALLLPVLPRSTPAPRRPPPTAPCCALLETSSPHSTPHPHYPPSPSPPPPPSPSPPPPPSPHYHDSRLAALSLNLLTKGVFAPGNMKAKEHPQSGCFGPRQW